MVVPKVYKWGNGSFAVQIHGQLTRFLGDPLVVMPLKKGEAFMSGLNKGELEEATPEEVEALRLTQEHVDQVCRSSQACRYLYLDPDEGFCCAKGSGDYDLVTDLDTRAYQGKMRSTGHNCEGRIGGTK